MLVEFARRFGRFARLCLTGAPCRCFILCFDRFEPSTGQILVKLVKKWSKLVKYWSKTGSTGSSPAFDRCFRQLFLRYWSKILVKYWSNSNTGQILVGG